MLLAGSMIQDKIADLSVKCTERHCKVEIFIRNHKACYQVLLY